MSISVSTLVSYLKNKLDSDEKLHGFNVSGELSNFHSHFSGHLYFTLKDEKSSIACVMFSSNAAKLKFNPKNGDQVELHGSVSLFEVSGQLQLYVTSMKIKGIGDLYEQYEALKNKLTNEGYFDSDHKKTKDILYPLNVAVIVGDKSAAMSDIKTCFKRRWPMCKVDYYPTLVQGKDAPQDIISNLLKIDKLNYDFIILARGGGSFEDLFCFNDEQLVKTIYNLKTFIISGIGHEQDFTLADFVSDLRAPTPTAAVELITPNIIDVYDAILSLKTNLYNLINNLINNKTMLLDYYQSSLNSYSYKYDNLNLSLNSLKESLTNSIFNKLESLNNDLNNNINLLKAYSIDNTLKRGFSLIYKDQKLINNTKDININDEIKIKLYRGEAKALVKETYGKSN